MFDYIYTTAFLIRFLQIANCVGWLCSWPWTDKDAYLLKSGMKFYKADYENCRAMPDWNKLREAIKAAPNKCDVHDSTPTIFFELTMRQKNKVAVMLRCLTLAGVMKARGWSCSFLTIVSMNTVPSLAEYPIVSTGYSHENVNVLIIDNYSLGASYTTRARLQARHIMIIDDLANRAHDCDILLDQTFGRKKRDY